MHLRTLTYLTAVGCLLTAAPALRAADEADRAVALAGGKITMQAPKTWEKKQPRTRIVEYEFAAKAAEGDQAEGRITIMGAGGGVEANIERWMGQFEAPKGKTVKDLTQVDKLTVDGVEVHVVKITGVFKDQPGGPFAGGKVTLRDNYQMLGAIITTEKLGDYFIKLYGPKATVAANEEALREMVKSLEVK